MTINSLEIVNKIEGNKKAISFFLKNLNITHDANIWMINGSKGIGKSFLVKLIVSNLLATEYKDNEYKNIFHPDLVVLNKNDDKKYISVDEIRNLKKIFYKTSFSGSYRIAIIDSINDLNLFGHNALLKTIEEPPKGSFIFIINHQNSFVPATIKSRCKTLNLQKLTDIEVLKVLEKMNFKLEEEELSFYSKISRGSVGDAIYFLKNNSLPFYKYLCSYFINIEDFNEIETTKVINLIIEKKNNLILAFFLLINLLFKKVIKKMFLNQYSVLIEEEKLLIEKFSKLYSKSNIFNIIDIIETKYNNYIVLNTDLHTTLYSLLIEMHKNIKK
jgi:DNA polymerase-3 subunit delta'